MLWVKTPIETRLKLFLWFSWPYSWTKLCFFLCKLLIKSSFIPADGEHPGDAASPAEGDHSGTPSSSAPARDEGLCRLRARLRVRGSRADQRGQLPGDDRAAHGSCPRRRLPRTARPLIHWGAQPEDAPEALPLLCVPNSLPSHVPCTGLAGVRDI